MLIPTSLIIELLKTELQVYTLAEFIEAKDNIISKSVETAGILEDYEYLSIMSKETDNYDGYYIVYSDHKYSSCQPIILEKKRFHTLNELAKIHCDTSIKKTEFYQIIKKAAESQTMDPASLYLQFDLYVDKINELRYISEHKFQRNDLCPCGSGLKYKKCHGINQ